MFRVADSTLLIGVNYFICAPFAAFTKLNVAVIAFIVQDCC